MIDLHADAKAVHDAKINAAINITALDVIDARDVSLSAVERTLPANACKLFGAWDKGQTNQYGSLCLRAAVDELASRAGVDEPARALFRMGFFGLDKEAEHAIEYRDVEGRATEEQFRIAFEAGRRCAEAYRAQT